MLSQPPIVQCTQPSASLVFHFDSNPDSICPATTLTRSVSQASCYTASAPWLIVTIHRPRA